jgi:hypothetical protein
MKKVKIQCGAHTTSLSKKVPKHVEQFISDLEFGLRITLSPLSQKINVQDQDVLNPTNHPLKAVHA